MSLIFVSQPTDRTVYHGGTASFTISVTGGTPTRWEVWNLTSIPEIIQSIDTSNTEFSFDIVTEEDRVYSSSYQVKVFDSDAAYLSDIFTITEQEFPYPFWDGLTDNATVIGVFEGEYSFRVGFSTDEDSVEARTGIEHLGVQFIDESTPGSPDGVGVFARSKRPLPDFTVVSQFAKTL